MKALAITAGILAFIILTNLFVNFLDWFASSPSGLMLETLSFITLVAWGAVSIIKAVLKGN